jgi:ketosteroid isomerase-like protein
VSTRDLIEEFIATLESRDWVGWVATMRPDVVYELPQSRERIRGRDRYLQFNQEFPGDWHLRPQVVVADDEHGSIWFKWRVGESVEDDAMVFFGFRDGLIATVTDFWPEAYEPPPGCEHLVERW